MSNRGQQASVLVGISTKPEQIAVWIYSISVCSHPAMAMDEEDSKRRELDRYYWLWILTELRKHPHPLTQHSDSLYNIVNGQMVSETKLNVQDAVEIGQ